MKKMNFRRTIAIFVCVFSGILCSCSSSKTQGKTQSVITYYETGHWGPTELWTIDFDKSEIYFEFSPEEFKLSSEDEGYCKYKYDEEETAEIVSQWRTFDDSIWQDRYEEPGVCDGACWRMTFLYSDGSQREISGHQAWPKDFKLFGIKGLNWGKTEKDCPWTKVQ